jgi:pre-rRNA-processing protein TSR3
VRILILRDPRESTAKCSLTPLRGLEGVQFVSYHPDRRISVDGPVLLDPEGEPLGEADRGRDLLLLDCAWRRTPRLRRTVDGDVRPRRLPPLETAYPRRSKTFADPPEGLASIEALYAATVLLGVPRPDLLDGYRWRDDFLTRNAARLFPDVP